MKKLLYLCIALLLAISTATAFAADPAPLTGAWTGSMDTGGNGTFQLTFTFKQDGAKFTGSVQAQQGEAIPISNGKIDGDKFTFEVSFNGMTITHSGTLTGDTIKLHTKGTGDFPDSDMTLKRAAAATTPAAPAAN